MNTILNLFPKQLEKFNSAVVVILTEIHSRKMVVVYYWKRSYSSTLIRSETRDEINMASKLKSSFFNIS